MSGLITAKHADIWFGGSLLTFIGANLVTINELLQAAAYLVTTILGVISIVARLRKNRDGGED